MLRFFLVSCIIDWLIDWFYRIVSESHVVKIGHWSLVITYLSWIKSISFSLDAGGSWFKKGYVYRHASKPVSPSHSLYYFFSFPFPLSPSFLSCDPMLRSVSPSSPLPFPISFIMFSRNMALLDFVTIYLSGLLSCMTFSPFPHSSTAKLRT